MDACAEGPRNNGHSRHFFTGPSLLPSRPAFRPGERFRSPLMAKSRPIRDKLLLGGLLVGVMVAILSASSFLGVYSYRRLVRALSSRAAELPLAAELDARVAALRLDHARALATDDAVEGLLAGVRGTVEALAAYESELEAGELDDVPFADRTRERNTARRIADCLAGIENTVAPAAGLPRASGVFGHAALIEAAPQLEQLAELTTELPTFLQQRLHDLSHEVRGRYRTLIVVTWASATAAAGLLAAIGLLTYRWVFRPLRHLGQGSRRVAAGDFAYRIHLETHDEMAELADALNDMTERFQAIRDDLDRQVQSRTREVIRSEQLASVGFLAAGVAHEINNPLASIAMCAESLESRLDALAPAESEAQVARRYLSLIQNEAFRCKGITEKLLDFARLGEVKRQATALVALVADVADMLRHVGRFAGRSIEIEEGQDVLVMVNPQEIKQVVLNLLVNAFDSIDEHGQVRVSARRSGGAAVLTVTDDGCGMTQEVLDHLFEPFFTRRKNGQGTGLGLSIVNRIITDHGGRIEATSDGPSRGSTFQVTLPLAQIGAVAGDPPAADPLDRAA